MNVSTPRAFNVQFSSCFCPPPPHPPLCSSFASSKARLSWPTVSCPSPREWSSCFCNPAASHPTSHTSPHFSGYLLCGHPPMHSRATRLCQHCNLWSFFCGGVPLNLIICCKRLLYNLTFMQSTWPCKCIQSKTSRQHLRLLPPNLLWPAADHLATPVLKCTAAGI